MSTPATPAVKHQIRLSVPARGIGEIATVPVWISTAAELRQELVSRGAKRLLLVYYDLMGDGRTEGTWFTIDELCDDNVAWLAATGSHVRALAYDTK